MQNSISYVGNAASNFGRTYLRRHIGWEDVMQDEVDEDGCSVVFTFTRRLGAPDPSSERPPLLGQRADFPDYRSLVTS
jgi:hypothetical protein